MSRGYVRLPRRWWQFRGRALLCCYGPCLLPGRAEYTVRRDGANWVYCSAGHMEDGG